MQITLANQLTSCDVLVLPIYKGKKIESKTLKSLSRNTNILIAEALKDKSFEGSLSESISVQTAKDKASKVLIVSLGEEKEYNNERLRRVFATVSKKTGKAKQICFELTELEASPALEGFLLARYKFQHYLSKKIKDELQKITLVGVSRNLKKDLEKTQKVCEEVSYVRDLVNDPDHTITPNYLAGEGKKLDKKYTSCKTSDFGMKQIEKMGMGALLAVGRGSVHTPHLVTIEYKPSNAKNKKPVVVVGKGVTFDTGGLNLKPTGHMETMKQDMAGAATILGLVKLVARLRLPIHLVGVMPLAENAISDKATKPGSIVTAYNGKTIEITNTDAEGRLILADALAYSAKKYKPEYMLDLATLTGAALVALGNEITAVIGNSQKLVDKYLESSKTTNEKAWQLPLDPDYTEQVKGTISDLVNFSRGVKAGTIMGAAFLSEFIGKTKNWIHLDIAGTAWAEKDLHYKPTGGTGEGLRTLIELVQTLWKG